MRGAFVVGVLRMMHQMGLDSNHFDAIYAVSSSVFAATYFSTGQVEQMESTWRYLVHGSQLIKLGNLFSKEGNAIDLDYLISLFRGRVYLDLEKLRTSRPRLIYVVTNMQSGSACYFSAKENIDLIFDLMMASASPRFLRRDSINNCKVGVTVKDCLCQSARQSLTVTPTLQLFCLDQRMHTLQSFFLQYSI